MKGINTRNGQHNMSLYRSHRLIRRTQEEEDEQEHEEEEEEEDEPQQVARRSRGKGKRKSSQGIILYISYLFVVNLEAEADIAIMKHAKSRSFARFDCVKHPKKNSGHTNSVILLGQRRSSPPKNANQRKRSSLRRPCQNRRGAKS